MISGISVVNYVHQLFFFYCYVYFFALVYKNSVSRTLNLSLPCFFFKKKKKNSKYLHWETLEWVLSSQVSWFWLHFSKLCLGLVWRTSHRERRWATSERPVGRLSPKFRGEMMVTVAMTVIEMERSERSVWTWDMFQRES